MRQWGELPQQSKTRDRFYGLRFNKEKLKPFGV
jgi:hypothetical protein